MRTAPRSLLAAALWLLLMLIPVGVATAAVGSATPAGPAASPVAGTPVLHASGAEDTTAPATETSAPGDGTGSDGSLFSGEAGGQVIALLVAAALFALVFYGRRIRKKARGG
ncbi:MULTISPECIES: hypothetical protein [Actinoalloteichus]|uniref:Uncharacterized protein n=1 Tax=Actinoalloteichus fjordicus TaxID=1612552 RepID=A0AAC9LGI6_9PSEU|nr:MULTISPECIES: hypothetical protein [Actinoalloteichus]APU17413.1 hypothetical protein UA74_27040 [Actinoalloteichus fjordicus]APU23497.1 hypothetical protein UA75_27630 [Actinoalloteichus sp. GBA129-24]